MNLCRNSFVVLTLLVSLVSVPAIANAQDRPQDYAGALKSACEPELTKFCGDVAGGEGRLLACLYSRESKLSGRCGTMVMNSLERLGVALGALANVVRVCQGDALRLCNGVIAGEGNLIG